MSDLLKTANFLKYLFLKKNSLPIYLTIFVTHRCTNDCFHCLDWTRRKMFKKEEELTIPQYKKIASSLPHVFTLMVTGGEPFIREDLDLIISSFLDKYYVPKVQIPSNGWFTDRNYQIMHSLVKAYPGTHFGCTISIDALGEKHDAIRNHKGSFERAVSTIEKLMPLSQKFKNFGVNAEITVSSLNENCLIETYEFLRKLGVKNILTPLVRGIPKDSNTLKVEMEKYRNFAKVVEKNNFDSYLGYSNFSFARLATFKDIIARQIVYAVKKDNRFILPCYAGKLSAVIYGNGDITHCELRDPILNLRDFDYDLAKLCYSEKFQKVTKEIKTRKCFCTHECPLSTNIAFNPKYFFKILYMWLKDIF